MLVILEITLYLWILIIESLIYKDVILISFKNDKRKSNDSTKLVLMSTTLSISLYYHDDFLLYFKDENELLFSIIVVKSRRRFVYN